MTILFRWLGAQWSFMNTNCGFARYSLLALELTEFMVYDVEVRNTRAPLNLPVVAMTPSLRIAAKADYELKKYFNSKQNCSFHFLIVLVTGCKLYLYALQRKIPIMCSSPNLREHINPDSLHCTRLHTTNIN